MRGELLAQWRRRPVIFVPASARRPTDFEFTLHAVKVYDGVKVQLHAFIVLELDGGPLSVSLRWDPG
jgi:hypothetical protein